MRARVNNFQIEIFIIDLKKRGPLTRTTLVDMRLRRDGDEGVILENVYSIQSKSQSLAGRRSCSDERRKLRVPPLQLRYT